MVEIAVVNAQNAINLKVDKPELCFMCSACRLISFYFTVTFREHTSDGIRVVEQTRIMEALTEL